MNKYRKHAKAAQKEVRRIVGCDRKRAYPSEFSAQQKGCKVYRCPHCELWHRATSIQNIINRPQRLVAHSKKTIRGKRIGER